MKIQCIMLLAKGSNEYTILDYMSFTTTTTVLYKDVLRIIQVLLILSGKLLHPFNGLFCRTTWVSRYQKGKTFLDFNEARDDGVAVSGIDWTVRKSFELHSRRITTVPHQNLKTQFLWAGCSSCRPTNSVKALTALLLSEKEDTKSQVITKPQL